MILRRETLKAVGLRLGQLAAICGVHRITVSRALDVWGRRPPPGTQAIVWLWRSLTDEQKAGLLRGDHLTDSPKTGANDAKP